MPCYIKIPSNAVMTRSLATISPCCFTSGAVPRAIPSSDSSMIGLKINVSNFTICKLSSIGHFWIVRRGGGADHKAQAHDGEDRFVHVCSPLEGVNQCREPSEGRSVWLGLESRPICFLTDRGTRHAV